MVVLAFLADPAVVGKIPRHFGLPTVAPVLAPARSPGQALGVALAPVPTLPERCEDDAGERATPDSIRPPP